MKEARKMKKIDEKKFVWRLSWLSLIFLVVGGLWKILGFDTITWFFALIVSFYVSTVILLLGSDIVKKIRRCGKKAVRKVKKIRKKKRRYIKIPLPF